VTDDGIVLNNEMDDFSSPGQVNSFGFAASPINYIAEASDLNLPLPGALRFAIPLLNRLS
jgi:gamma-glutamyltranspeptidase